jgi:sugar lactone lactonase YvrE
MSFLLAILLLGAIQPPDGFHSHVFASGLENSGTVLVLEDGTVLVSRPELNDVLALRDTDGDGRADRISTAVSSIENAHGLAMRGRTLYIAGVKKIVAADRRADGTFRLPREIVGDLPDGGQHPNRLLGIGPDGKLYVAIGSSCSECRESNPEHGTVLQMNADGSNRRVFARGLKNVTAFGWNESGEMWGIDGEQPVRIGDGIVQPSDRPAHVAEFVAENGVVHRFVKGDAPMTSSVVELPPMPVLRKEFRVAGLQKPDSVIYDEEQDVYLVSNAGGFVSKIAPSGKIVALRFIDKLDSPKGIAIRGRELWVTDGTRLHAFDRASGERISELFVSESVMLTGIAVGSDDLLYVTDAGFRVKPSGERERVGDGRVYRVDKRGQIEVATQGEELLSPNGIAWDGTRFVIAQSYGRELLAWTPGSRAKAIVRGPGAYDGIAVLPNGAVLVSSQHDEAIHVLRNGELVPLFTRRPTPAGIAFDHKRNRLLVPSTTGGWLEAWTLPPIENRNAVRDDDEDEPVQARIR